MKILLSALSGLIASLGFAPYSLWFAPFFALPLLFEMLKKQRVFTRVLMAQSFGLGLLLPNQFWTGTYVGKLPWIILAVMQSFLFWPFALRVKKGGSSNAWLFACNAVIVELLLRTVPFTGFGWSRLSFTQVDGPLSKIYPILGCAGVIFTIAYLSANRKFLAFILAVLLVTSVNIFAKDVKPKNQIEVALVQGGVKTLGLDFNSTPREVFQRHLETSLNEIPKDKVDLIIWPENAVDVDLYKFADVRESIVDASVKLNTPILIGGITNSNGELRNISVLFEPNPNQVYTKRYLTPFGEYIPLRTFLKKFTNLTDQVDDFTAGRQSNQISLKEGKTQIFICYELLNDKFKNEISSDFLTVQTNNATFGNTAQLDQELQIARVRALETGREVAYVSTTGVTAIIDRNGQIKSQIPKFTSNVLFDTINTYDDQQLNQKLSFLPEILAMIMVFFILMWSRRSF